MSNRVGKLRHRLVLREPAMLQDPSTGELLDSQQPDGEWNILGTVWASIEPLRGTELKAGVQILSSMDTRIVVRWSELTNRLTQAHSGYHQGVVYNFISLAQLRLEQRYIEIMSKSGITNG